jgi:enoyl-CoA hydratase
MSISNFETILFEQKDEVGIITINREKKLNALSEQVLGELTQLLEEIKDSNKDWGLKGLILTGAGEKAFIAGADIKEMTEMDLETAKKFGKLGQDLTLSIENMPIPVIAAVNGFALGGGCEMAMSCDFIYATEASIFGQPEVKLGLIPGFGGTQRLARIVGRNRAKEFIFTGENITAQRAYEMGLVTKLFTNKEELMAAAMKTINKMAKNSPMAIYHSKMAVNKGVDIEVEKGLDSELNYFASSFATEDMKEGTLAFIEKRSPNFTGK